MKKLAVVVGGWHFPLHPYQALVEQKVPEGWSVDFFCVSHRDPKYSKEEKQKILPNLGYSYRAVLDRVLYAEFATPEKLAAIGFHYKEYPNTMGDWAMTNQWLEENDYKDYDVILTTHDDNIFPTDQMFVDLLGKEEDWLIITNSKGYPNSWRQWLRNRGVNLVVRGSFEFFKREMLERIGGSFDMGKVSLTREGEHFSPKDAGGLSDWNKHVEPLLNVIRRDHLVNRVKWLSPFYRVSKYCIEGERGFISYTQKRVEASENVGFAELGKREWAKHLSWLRSFYEDEDQ